MSFLKTINAIGRPIAYYPNIAKAIGSVKAAIFLCQFLYWEGKQKDKEGWIYKTMAEISDETGLSRSEIEGARRELRKKGILKEELRGMPAKLHFLFDWDKVEELLQSYNDGRRLRKTCEQGCRKPANKVAENLQSYKDGLKFKLSNNNGLQEMDSPTEITTETTTETTRVAEKNQQQLSKSKNKNKKSIPKSKDSSDKFLRRIRDLSVGVYLHLYKERAGYKYKGDYGKLYKLAEKFAKEILETRKEKRWDNQNMVKVIWLYLLFYFVQGKADIPLLFGKYSENLLEIQESKKKKNWKHTYYQSAKKLLLKYKDKILADIEYLGQEEQE